MSPYKVRTRTLQKAKALKNKTFKIIFVVN